MGNGATDMDFDGNSLVPFAHGMGLISEELYEVYILLYILSWNKSGMKRFHSETEHNLRMTF